MSREEFIIFIKSIGFKSIKFNSYYNYKEYGIYLLQNNYNIYNGSKWFISTDYNDLITIENYFKGELRSIKLKQILK